jgi:hypothetical protein
MTTLAVINWLKNVFRRDGEAGSRITGFFFCLEGIILLLIFLVALFWSMV